MARQAAPGTPDADAPSPTVMDESAERFVRLVQELIDPLSWADAGGTVGKIKYFGGWIIVFQSPEAHGHLAEFLRQLRDEKRR
jgi:hypothetical protein